MPKRGKRFFKMQFQFFLCESKIGFYLLTWHIQKKIKLNFCSKVVSDSADDNGTLTWAENTLENKLEKWIHGHKNLTLNVSIDKIRVKLPEDWLFHWTFFVSGVQYS